MPAGEAPVAGRKRQGREDAWPKGMYAYQNGDGYFFERRSRRVRGGRVWEPLGEDRNRAIARATEMNDSINRGDYEKTSSSGRRLSVAEFFEIALSTRESHAPKTYAGYRSRVNHFLAYLCAKHMKLNRLGSRSAVSPRPHSDSMEAESDRWLGAAASRGESDTASSEKGAGRFAIRILAPGSWAAQVGLLGTVQDASQIGEVANALPSSRPAAHVRFHAPRTRCAHRDHHGSHAPCEHRRDHDLREILGQAGRKGNHAAV